MIKRVIAITLLSMSVSPLVSPAQERDNSENWYIGVGGGFHSNSMRYSNLDKDIFPEKENLNSGVFSLFLQYEFGSKNQFGIRPEIAFLRRGGKLPEIGKKYYGYGDEVDDVLYKLKSKYWDIRFPFSYNFCGKESAFRPYVFLAPILGFSTGGNIKLQADMTDGSYAGYGMDLSDANMASTYFAGAVGAGVKYQFKVGTNRLFLGLEASYEYGFTDTYGSKEKDGKANNLLPTTYEISGTRKFQGFEIKAMLGIPFSVFKKKQPEASPVIMPVKEEEPVVEEALPVVEEQPCYTLEEITGMMARGERVEGKTICAIDAINFDFGKSTIQKGSYAYLDKLALTLIRTDAQIEVKGHTDNIGTAEFNMNLSKERAESVVKYLISKGVKRDKLSYSYYGMSKPLTSNDTEHGRTINRRVEFEILNDK